MRDLTLLSERLVRLRQDCLKMAHHKLISSGTDLFDVKLLAHKAELCSMLLGEIKILAEDPGKFIKEFLPHEP